MTRDEIAVASAELLRRREVRRGIVEWCRYAGYEPAKHHRLLLDALTRVANGEIKRLAVTMPPGSAKSTYSSVLFPPWFMANHPGKSIIAASHSTELAERWGRRVRNLIAEHGRTLGIELSKESQAAGRWALSSGGEYYAAGTGTGIAGFRADGVLCDDILRGSEEASSESARGKLWEWFKSDLTTRLRPGGWLVMVGTRWHTDDIIARALNEDEWEIINLPAEAEANDPLGREVGELLWNDDSSYDYASFLRHEKATQLPSNWTSLFQGRPVSETGDFFKAEWLRPFQAPPPRESLNIYVGVDFALSAGKGDHTAIAVIGCDPEDNLWLLHVWRKQANSATSVDALLDICRDFKPIVVAQESGQIARGIGPWLRKRMDERKIWVATEEFAARGDKAVRASSMRGRMAAKGLFYPAGADWFPAFREELLGFPNTKFDDQCDAIGLCGLLIDKMGGKRAPAEKPVRKLISTVPGLTSATLDDLFRDNERHAKRSRPHLVARAPTKEKDKQTGEKTRHLEFVAAYPCATMEAAGALPGRM